MIDVKSYTDRKGNKVRIGDKVGYFRIGSNELLMDGKVRRIKKAGYHIEVFVEGRNHSLSTAFVELLPEQVNTTTVP